MLTRVCKLTLLKTIPPARSLNIHVGRVRRGWFDRGDLESGRLSEVARMARKQQPERRAVMPIGCHERRTVSSVRTTAAFIFSPRYEKSIPIAISINYRRTRKRLRRRALRVT